MSDFFMKINKKAVVVFAIVVSSFFGSSFLLTKTAQGKKIIVEANKNSQQSILVYRAPPQRKEGKPPQRDGSGSRTSCISSNLPQILIAPESHLGLTTLSHPTFSVYFAENPKLPVSVSIEIPREEKDLWFAEIEVKQAGIATFTIPSHLPGLEIGKEYRWTVALICDRKKRIRDIYAEAPIERVQMSQELKQKLTSAKNSQAKAQILADEGLFYDTMNEINKVSTTNERNTLLVSLLEQISLDDVVQGLSLKSISRIKYKTLPKN